MATFRRSWQLNRPPDGPFAINRQSPQAYGLAGWWPMLASRDMKILRDLANANNGTFDDSPTWINDADFGSVLSFNGSSNKINCGTSNHLNNTGNISLATFFRTNSFASEFYLIGKDVGSEGTASENAQYSLAMEAGKTLKTFWEYGTGTNVTASSSVAATLNTGEWHHACVVRKSGGTIVDFYFDGNKLGTSVSGLTAAAGGEDSPLILGGLRPSNVALLDGELFEPRIYKRALSPAEVWQLYDPATRWQLYQPLRRQFTVKAPTVVGLPIPVAMRYYRNQRVA